MRLTRLLSASLLTIAVALPSTASVKPEDYTLELTILREHVERTTIHNHGFNDTTYVGDGQARLLDHGKLSGVDFTYSCDTRYARNMSNEHYRAKWKKPGTEMEVIAEVIGKPGSFHTCTFKTTMHADVYVLDSHGEIITTTQAEFEKRMAARAARQAAPAPSEQRPTPTDNQAPDPK